LLEREVPSGDRPSGQKSPEKDIGTEMHVMVPIHPLRLFSVQATEFTALGCDNILKRTRKARVKYDAAHGVVVRYIGGNFLLSIQELGRTVAPRKRRRKIYVKTRVYLLLASDIRSSLRILHEYHSAHRGNGPTPDAFQCPVCRQAITPPIVRVHD
jgi:hypothetical protein